MIADQLTDEGVVVTEGSAAVSEAESLLKQNAAAKATLVGLSADEVKVGEIDYPTLMQSALAVKIHTFCPTFETVIDPEDFGIVPQSDEEREAWRKNVKVGKIGTLPEKIRRKIAAIKGRRVDHYNRYANDTSFPWGGLIKLGAADETRTEGYNFVEWLNGDNKIVDEFKAVDQEIYDNWTDMMAEIRGEYKLLGIGVYARMKDTEEAAKSRAAKAGDPAPESKLGTLEDFVDRFVNKRMAKIVGKRDEVHGSMSMTREIRDIPLASQMAADQAQAEQVLLDKAKVKSELTVMEQIQIEKLRTAREEIKEGATTLLADLKSTTNGLVYKTARNVLQAIQKNGEVPGGSVKGIRNLVENIERLTILPDEQIEAQMVEIRRLLDQESLNDDLPGLQTVMKRIAAESKLVLMELNREVDSSRDVGVPDTLVGLRRVTGLEGRGSERTQRLDLTDTAPVVAAGLQRDGERDF